MICLTDIPSLCKQHDVRLIPQGDILRVRWAKPPPKALLDVVRTNKTVLLRWLKAQAEGRLEEEYRTDFTHALRAKG